MHPLLRILPLLLTMATVGHAGNYELAVYGEWTIHIEIRDNPDQSRAIDQAYQQLKSDLSTIEQLIPEEQLKSLKSVAVWISYQTQRGAAYHPSKQWLIKNDRNPDMAQSIEIQNATDYTSWVKHQPMIILHEFTHAYHHQALGYTHQEIKAAYEQAKERGDYDDVPHWNGKRKRAYAMTNDKEYFAEVTEAYFGRNDIYPFTRDELKAHDPTAYELVERLWNVAPVN